MTTKEEESDDLSKEFVVANVRLLVESLERTRTFAEAVDDHRRLEAEFVARAPDNEFHVLETRRGIAETILSLAYEKHPPFEACRAAWNEMVRLGFKDLGARCDASRFYADCCAYDKKTEEGLEVLEPLVADYRRIEADFAPRAGDASRRFMRTVKRRIAEDLLWAASRLEQPFEVCRDAWNELVRLGFTDLWEQCQTAQTYVASCLRTHKPEEGLAVLEPLIAELERGLEAELARRGEAQASGEVPMKAGLTPTYYRDMLRSFVEFRDKLEAQRKGGAPST
ncbi:MAG TPA: hypothetical protein VM694_33540 [Polyangium sp.]|nr:hypothetical protein [Polyangium sp.]